ncbi:replication protein A 70 kDa DNA-binding subunit B, partial [Tanacetum coccineum]
MEAALRSSGKERDDVVVNDSNIKTPGQVLLSGGGLKGYRKGSGYCGYGSSKGFVGSGGAGGEDSNKKITPISEVDPMLDNIAVQGRCISIWHSHRLNAAHDPYSLDLVLQDAQNNRIQVYIKKEFMFRFEPLFEEGQCYTVSNFGIAENGGRLPLLPHRYKISFYKSTIVTRIEPFDNNTHGFVMEPYNRLLDTEHHHYYEQDVVDVIGSVVGIGDIVPVMSAAGKKVRRTVVTEDAEGNRLDFTFWDNWATIWDEYAMNPEAMGHVVFILQLCKVKYWDGTPVIHNALFGSKIFINRDLPQIAAFRTRVQDREGYDANQLMIQHVAPEVKVVTVAEFFHRAVKKMVGGIRECDPDSHCIVYATIHRIHKEHGWAYTACKSCNKREPNDDFTTPSTLISKVNMNVDSAVSRVLLTDRHILNRSLHQEAGRKFRKPRRVVDYRRVEPYGLSSPVDEFT